MLKEEGRIMLDFDTAPTMEARLKALDGLLRCRRMVMDMIGWPKPPTLRPGRLPCALDAVKSHNPLGDVDVESMTVLPEPMDPGATPGTAPLEG